MPQLFLSNSVDVQEGILDCLVRNALLVIRGTLKEAPGRELVFLEHLQLVEEDIMEIQHAVFRVSCARVLSQVFQTNSPTNAILTRMTKLLVPDVHLDIRGETVENALMDTKGIPIHRVTHVEGNKEFPVITRKEAMTDILIPQLVNVAVGMVTLVTTAILTDQ
jgi:hypothetical protein